MFKTNPVFPFGGLRTVDLGVATLSFALQEDFGRDMPAEPLIEQIDIGNRLQLDQLNHGLILQRWWDIQSYGWFSKNLGTLMMTIGVHPAPDNFAKLVHERPYNLLDRLDLMLALNDRFHQMYDQHNQEVLESGSEEYSYFGASVFSILQNDYRAEFRDSIVNNTKWISYGVSGPDWEVIEAYALPLSREIFVELRFTYSRNKHLISATDFEALLTNTRLTPLLNSIIIHFNKESSQTKSLVQGSWLTETNNQVMQKHIDLLREKFPPGKKVEYIAPPDEEDCRLE